MNSTGTGYRATTIQRGMWLASQLAPAGSEFTVSTAYRLTGHLDTAALRRALDGLVRRHPILRLRFVAAGDEDLSAYVLPPDGVMLDSGDLSGLPVAQARRSAVKRVEATARSPFDLGRGPLIRVSLLQVSEHEHVLSLHVHHAVCDGWSMHLLLDDLRDLYASALAGDPGVVADRDETVPYFGCADVPEDEVAAELGYWRERLAGAEPPVLPLVGTARSGSGACADHRFTIDPQQFARTADLARRAHTTPFVVLLAAFSGLVGRMCSTGDVMLGTTMSTRMAEEAQLAIGPLFNTVALRCEANPDGSFEDAVDATTQTVFDALEHVRAPFERVLDAVRAQKRATTTNPLFDVLFEFDHDKDAVPELAGLACERFEFTDHTPKSDLMVSLKPDGDGLAGTLTYRTERCDAAGAAAVADGFVAFLDAALTCPTTALRELPGLTGTTSADVVGRFADGGAAGYPEVCVHELVEAQTRRTPDAVAVRELRPAGRTLTFAELNAAANRLARHLRQQGVGPEDRVGVLLNRSVDLVVGLLAVWKAGGAYVPLDPGFPNARLRFVTDDAAVVVVVTEQALADKAIATGRTLVTLDDDRALTCHGGSDLEPVVGPRGLAYVMHTSGSTGTPKGVLVEHRGLVNYLDWCARRYAVHGDGGAPLFSSIAFDMVVPNLYTPLVTGQAVAIVPEDTPPDHLGRVLSTGAPYSFIKLTPGHLELLTGQLSPDEAAGVAELLVVGADTFPLTTLRDWRRLAPDMPVFNEYGPTETSVANCAHAIEATDVDLAGAAVTLPIGRPIPNTTMYVLDPDGRPVAPGIVGEIHIGGDCVARGYANRPETTAERFVHDDFGLPGGRLYRTGDKGRWLPDGEMEFLGRTDHQVSVRGYRIEPGEVEAALTALPAVRQALVMSATTPAGEPALVAYTVPVAGAEFQPTVLRKSLATTLPAYMVPSLIIAVDAVPLNQNGKVDRSALPAPIWGSTSANGASGLPGDTERAVAEVWSSVLGLPVTAFGPDDNFFELGGNSLLVLSAVTRLRERCSTSLDFVRFLANPTVTALAGLIDSAAGEDEPPSASLGVLSDGGAGVPIVLVHPLGGTVLCYQHLVEALRGVSPLYGLTLAELRGADPYADGSPRAGRRLEEITAGYAEEVVEALLGAVVVAGWSAGAVIAFDLARQLRERGTEVTQLVLLDPSPLEERNQWRADVRRLETLRSRLGSAAGDGPEAELRAAAESGLLHDMGIDFATCRDPSVFPRDILRIWVQQLRVLGAYEAHRYDGPITILTSHEQSVDDSVQLVAQWQGRAARPVTHLQGAGDHLSMLQPPAVDSTAAMMRDIARPSPRAAASRPAP